jgi:hypothetical protein
MTRSDVGPASGRHVTVGARSARERGDDRSEARKQETSARAALAVFVLVEVVAGGLWLALGRRQWFWLDEWDFLTKRGVTAHDLLDDHNGHWSALPILVYRALWSTVGLRSYLPYLATLIVLHLVTAALLLVLMRRVGVNVWIATAATSAFVLFGTGWQNIEWAFQIGFVGALALGLTQLLLADHEGPIDRRDLLGVFAGLAALMCSSIAVSILVVVAIAALSKRGLAAAALHAVPLGLIYLAWWIPIGRRGAEAGPAFGTARVDTVGRFVAVGFRGTFRDFGTYPGIGLLVALVLCAGLFLAWRPFGFTELRRRAAIPAAFLCGAVFFLIMTGYTRVGFFGPEIARSSRYEYVVLALCLVPIAVALDAFVRRWHLLLPVACVLLLVGVPGNIDTLADHTRVRSDSDQQYRRLILGIAHDPRVAVVPPGVRVDTSTIDNAGITAGFLHDAADSGRAPAPRHLSARERAEIRLRLSFLQTRPAERRIGRCEPLTKPVTRRLTRRAGFVMRDYGVVVSPSTASAPHIVLTPQGGGLVRASLDPITVVLRAQNPFLVARLCSYAP